MFDSAVRLPRVPGSVGTWKEKSRTVAFMGFNFNLKDQLTFYGSYHNNKWNQLIHLFFVPLILWTVAVWLAYTGPLFPYDFSEHLGFLPDNLSRYLSFIIACLCSTLPCLSNSCPTAGSSAAFPMSSNLQRVRRFVVLNASFIVLSAYSLYYIILDFLAGLSWTLVYAIPLWLTSTAFEQLVPNAWAIALGLHVFAWYMQIHPGHLVLEGRKPALFDSFFQVRALRVLCSTLSNLIYVCENCSSL